MLIDSLYSVESVIHGVNDRALRRAVIHDPATGAQIGSVGLADTRLVEAAVEAAHSAFPAWADRPPTERARVLMKFRELVERHKLRLADLITLEHGKPQSDAFGSIQRGIEVVEFAAAAPHLLKGESSDHVARGISTRMARKPLGICAGITPFNYPAMIPLWMFPLALACGNTFILKPSERTPSAANLLAELLFDAGAPPGVLSVLHGDRDTAAQLVAHPKVAAISFVGSSTVAKAVYATAAAAGKRVQALGGAKNHAIILPDADPDLVVDGLLNGAFNSAGQRCMAISVAVFVGDADKRFLPRIMDAARRLVLGPGTDSRTQVPPVTSAAQKSRILRLLDEAEQAGAELPVDGRTPAVGRANREGFFVGPTVVDRVTKRMAVYQEEVFGPVLVLLRAADLDEAIELANSHELANGAVLFTSSGAAATRFERLIACGMPGVNVPVPSPVAYHSFGGWKNSFFGDLAVHGTDGIQFYTRRQTLTSRWTS